MSEFSALRGARILVTGGAGMLGSAIAQMALEAGAEVIALDADESPGTDEIPGTEVRSIPWPPSRALVETGDYVTDIARLAAATSWSPSVSLRDGIKLTTDYYRERRHLYR
jgi:nucleoside-diphosphate-sugar epimerase